MSVEGTLSWFLLRRPFLHGHAPVRGKPAAKHECYEKYFVLVDFGTKVAYTRVAVERVALAVR